MKNLLFTLLLLAGTQVFAADNPDAVVGLWQNSSGKGHIQIFKQGVKYFGKIVWLRDAKDAVTGQPKVDRKNPDEALRKRPLTGLVMLRDFQYSDGEWNNGRIYNPSDGKEYKGYMKMKDDNTLDVRGYIGFSFLGKTDTWTRVK